MRTIREVMEMDVGNLEFSVRCKNGMKNMNVKKLCELTSLSKEELPKMRNIGKKSVEEIDKKLSELGLWWKMTDSDWVNWGLAHLQWIKSH